MLHPEIMYQALLDKDAAFEGLFIAAVKTTGIFCRPTCTAKKPKPENVTFFATVKEALEQGFRPCKVCRPMEQAGVAPPAIQRLTAALDADPSLKLPDEALRQEGIEPATLRRWFQKHYGISFRAYQRMLRINAAFRKIREGESVTATAFETGYDSLSGFGNSFKAVTGLAPSHSRRQQVILSCRFDTPLGPMIACTTEKGICLLEFADREILEAELQTISQELQAPILPGRHAYLDQVREELAAYFSGTLQVFRLPLDTPGTPFQQSVWQLLQTIPYGSTRSYKEQALLLGKPEAIRAVAAANGKNRIAILIPCHRVIGADGKPTGYGGGIYRKQWLLQLEREQR